jgi:hypothetical protein
MILKTLKLLHEIVSFVFVDLGEVAEGTGVEPA